MRGRTWWKTLLAVTVLLHVAIAATAADSAGQQESDHTSGKQVEQVIVVFKTHFDIGYTELAREVVERYRTTMIDKALDVCDATRELPPQHRFVWTLSGWPMTQILWPGQTAERRARVIQAIRDGRLVWHALPGTTHTESMDLEDIVRGLGFSTRLSRALDLPLPRDAKMTDVPSHCWILPTILKRAGVDFLHLGCNRASTGPDVPRLFWWEGPDGSRLLTMYSITYGSDLKPPDDWPHKTWLALIHTGDNQGPPTPEDVKKLLQRARKELPGVRIRMGRLSDFGDAIRAENPDLPVVRADMPDTWIHGILSMPIETAIARRVRPAIAALEALDTLLSCWGVEHPATKPDIAAAYEGSFLYGEHTWGYDAKRFPRLYGEAWKAARAAGKYRRLEQSWADHGEYIRKAERLVKPKLTDCMEALARAVQVDGPRVVVFNPLPWARDDVVTIRVDSARLAQASLVDVATGQRVATERDGSTVRFVARDLPPLGYRTYAPAGQQSSATVRMEATSPSATFENRFFRIELDPDRGAIRSWIDKQTGRELVDAESEYGFGQYLYERFDADDASGFYEAYCRVKVPWARADFAKPELPPASEVPHLSASPENFRLTVRRGPVATTATMSAPPSDRVPHGVLITITLYDALPLLDLAWTVENKQADPWPEAGWLCFPLRIDEPSFRLARPGVVIDPARDIRRSANHEVFCLAGGVTISGADGFGAGLCPVESPLVSLGRPGLYRYSRQFGRRGPAVFVNLYNNTWGTNFQQWIGGTWTSRVRLWVTRTGQPEAVRTADLVTRSWQARSRSKAAWTDGPAGNLHPARTGLELSRRGTLVTSFGLNPDGDGIVLRLWEQTGRSGTCRIRLPSGLPVTHAQPCDLRGQWQGDPIPIRQGCFDLSLSAYAPSSVLLHSER